MSDKKKPQLRTEVAEKYELAIVGEAGMINHPKYGMVDLATIDLKRAEKLAAATDFNYLVEKKSSPKK